MPVPIINVGQMREWEKATWASGQTEAAVIECVGKKVAERILLATDAGMKILILAGKGHNGDDARAAIPHLSNRKATLIDVLDPNVALAEFQNLELKQFRFVVDGLFGVGLNRPLNDAWQKLINTINNSRILIMAIDVPSGLNAETGKPEGSSIRAAITLTVGAPKQGMLFPEAIPFVGRLETLSDVGLVPPPHKSELNWILPEDFNGFPPPRPVASHKGSFGHVAIIAGSVGYHGAAVLTSHGALRAQPGLVTVFPQEPIYVPVASQLEAAMVHPWISKIEIPKNCTAIMFGPGLAARDLSGNFKDELRSLWTDSPLPVVVDASALDWLPSGVIASKGLRVITPHPGEAARLLNSSTKLVQADRVGSLRKISERYSNCWVVLKGHQTLIGRETGDIFVNGSGNPFLAQGGSGDVLAGLLGGLLAQPSLASTPEKTICYGVWRHGAAADALSDLGKPWTSEDLARAV